MSQVIASLPFHAKSAEALQSRRAAILCDWCSDILVDTRYQEGKIVRRRRVDEPEAYQTLEQLKVGNAAACPVCSTVYHTRCKYDSAMAEEAQFTLSIRYKMEDGLPEFTVYETTATPQLRWGFELVPIADMTDTDHRQSTCYEPPINSSDPKVTALIQAWSSECFKKHTRCHQKPSLYRPPRLIEIRQDRIRLTTTGNTDDNNFETPYATLSHCWGKNPTFLRLTEQNLHRLHDAIDLHELPKTFRDTIVLCRRLNLQYLWIDSLCIIQEGEGSKEDWLRHVTEMRNVYRHGLVNIAASRAADATHGLYAERNPAHITPPYIYSSGDGMLPAGHFFLVHQTISEHGWQRDPLTGRGWV